VTASITAAAPVRAQSLTTGAIQGVVIDAESEEPLPGVTVMVGSQLAITDRDGAYKITELVPGRHDVVIELDTTRVTRSGVVVSAGAVTTLVQKLRIGESIRIDGTPPPINTVSTAHEGRVDRAYLESMPVPGPTFEAALGAVPGSQGDGVGVAFSGSSSLENRYLVDGIDITGLTFGEVGTPILNDFIHEIQIVTGGYSAEYGRSTGGIVNIVTRTGTDQFRGSVFGVMRPGWLAARSERTPVNASSIDVSRDLAYTGHLGFELGGPIVKKRAWYYVGVAPRTTATDFTRTTKRQTDCRTLLPSGELSSCAPEHGDGEPDRDPATGFYLTDDLDRAVLRASSRSTSMIAKLNFAASPDDQAQVSLIAVPSSSRSPALFGVPSTGRRTSGLTTDAAVRWTSKLDAGRTELEGLAALHRATFHSGALDPSFDAVPLQRYIGGDLGTFSQLGGESVRTAAGCRDGGAGDAYPFIINCPMASYTRGGPGDLARDRETRHAVRLSVLHRARAFGSHELKAGLDYENNTKTMTRVYSGGAFIEPSPTNIRVRRWIEVAPPGSDDPRFDRTCRADSRGDQPPLRCRYIGGTPGEPGTEIDGQTLSWGAYVRDSWQPARGLTIDAGLRYEEQRLRYASTLRNRIDPLTGNPLGTDAIALRGNLSPRLGVIYDPTLEGRSKVYAHWGRYIEAIPMNINDRSFGGELAMQQDYRLAACGQADAASGLVDGADCVNTTAPADVERVIGSSGVLVAPGLRAQYMDETLAGAELAVRPDVVLGLVLQYRRLGRAIEDVSPDGAETYVIANPGEWSALEEAKLEQRIARTADPGERARLGRDLERFRAIRRFDRPVRDYHAIELNVARRFASGLFLQASYTWSRTEGNYPGLISYDNGQIDPNISSQYDLIELLGNRRGRLPQDRPHYVKLDAYRGFSLGTGGRLTVGARIRALSGTPSNALGAHYLYGPDEAFLLPRGTLRRTDFEHGADLHVAYRRELTKTTAAELYVDVFNLYNRQGSAGVDTTYAPPYALYAGGAGGQQQNANPISGGTYEDLIWAKAIDRDGVATSTPLGRNPNFGRTTARYAPASAQVGFRVTF
jgi:outer membrane receptor protein involved in Fe transport